MRLQAGTQVGGYQVIEPLGAGGMGEVYRARDTRLKRDVALKVLAADVAATGERFARFQREAEVLASLSHPNIAAIHGLVEADGVMALVMELVDGEDLAQRLKRGPVPIKEALAIARQIAEGIEAAHEHGIVHRDLKPANIKLRGDGTVKVLDFGLAKALDPDSSSVHHDTANSPTISSPAATLQGVVLGTAAYMSPEQARGKTVDKRTDVWAFGVILYEMLTARRPFQGETVSDSIAAILKVDPDWSALPEDTPFLIKRLMRHCLNRDSRERLGDIRDARIEITEALTGQADVVTPRRPSRVWVTAAVSLAIVLAIIMGGFASGRIQLTPSVDAPDEVRFAIDSPPGLRTSVRPVVSPDGRHIGFFGFDTAAMTSVWIHELATGTSRQLRGTERADPNGSMFWSPDSSTVAFFADNQLKRVGIRGGTPTAICEAFQGRGGSWGRNNDIIFGVNNNGPLLRVSASAGTPKPITNLTPGGMVSHRLPHFFADGNHFVFAAGSAAGAKLMLGSLDSTETTELRTIDGIAGTVGTDLVLFVSGGQLLAQRVDVSRAALSGDVTGIAELQAVASEAWASVSSDGGTLAYRRPPIATNLILAWVDRSGRVTNVPLPPRTYADPSLSPDGRQIALALLDDTGQHIWVYDVERGSFGKRTFASLNRYPIWSHDGRSLTFSTGQSQAGPLVRMRADGSGTIETVVATNDLPGQKVPTSWSPDGTLLALQRGLDVYVKDASGRVAPLLNGTAFEREARFAPSGQWIAYRSNESGRDEVYVQSYPIGSGKWQISTDGGAQPMWNPNGKELFFKNGNRLMVTDVELTPRFKPGVPRVLFEMPLPEATLGDPSRYGVSPDGQRFLVITTDKSATSNDNPVYAILNWQGRAQLKH